MFSTAALAGYNAWGNWTRVQQTREAPYIQYVHGEHILQLHWGWTTWTIQGRSAIPVAKVRASYVRMPEMKNPKHASPHMIPFPCWGYQHV